MWPRWTSRSLMLLTAARTAVAEVGVPIETLPGHAGDGIEDALARLDGFSPSSPARRSWSVLVDDDWTRTFGLDWPDGLTDSRLYRNWVASAFEQRFDVPAREWHIAASGTWPGRRALHTAIRVDAMAAIERDLGLRRMRLSEVLPWSMGELRAALRIRPRKPMMIVGSRAPRRAAFMLVGGRIVDYLSVPGGHGGYEGALQLFCRRNPGLPVPRTILEVDADRDAAQRLVLQRAAVPVRRVAELDPGFGAEPGLEADLGEAAR